MFIFSDMIYKVIKSFQEDKEALEYYKKKYFFFF